MKQIKQHTAGLLDRLPRSNNNGKIHELEANALDGGLGAWAPEGKTESKVQKQVEFKLDPPQGRRILGVGDNSLSIPNSARDSDSEVPEVLDFEVVTAASFDEFVRRDGFVGSGEAVVWLFDECYPPDPEWKYSGQKTEEEIGRFCGHLMVLDVVRPVAEVRDKEEVLCDYRVSRFTVLTWNVNGLRTPAGHAWFFSLHRFSQYL